LPFVTLQKKWEKLRKTLAIFVYSVIKLCIQRVGRILNLWETRLLEDGFIIRYVMQSEYGLYQLERRWKLDVRCYNDLHVIVLQDNWLPDLLKHISIGAGEWSWKYIYFKNKLAVESDFLRAFILTITVWIASVNLHFIQNKHCGHILL
jgi:hypothetical protein